jgi:hypothetical protein
MHLSDVHFSENSLQDEYQEIMNVPESKMKNSLMAGLPLQSKFYAGNAILRTAYNYEQLRINACLALNKILAFRYCICLDQRKSIVDMVVGWVEKEISCTSSKTSTDAVHDIKTAVQKLKTYIVVVSDDSSFNEGIKLAIEVLYTTSDIYLISDCYLIYLFFVRF